MSGHFFNTLRELRQGLTLDELDSAMPELVAAVKGTNKPGQITLTIKMRPPKKGGGKYLHVEAEVVSKLPKPDKGDTVFYTLSDNSLSRQDPDQKQLDLRPVPSGKPLHDPVTGEIRAS